MTATKQSFTGLACVFKVVPAYCKDGTVTRTGFDKWPSKIDDRLHPLLFSSQCLLMIHVLGVKF